MVAFSTAISNRLVIDLKNHHGQCEINYHLCMGLIPDCRQSASAWSYTLNSEDPVAIKIKRIESAPYTTTIEIAQSGHAERYIATPKLVVRLYHDAEMAEVVAWDNHRHWRPVYSYPNRKMYQRDEKLVLNRFLGEWLVHCRKLGLSQSGFVSPLS